MSADTDAPLRAGDQRLLDAINDPEFDPDMAIVARVFDVADPSVATQAA